jgi:hypothetical protein
MTAARAVRYSIALLVVAVATLLPVGAQAYWRGGVFFSFPPVYLPPPPVYYYPPPPAYVVPPPYVAPPTTYQVPTYNGPPAAAAACYAGPWVCPLDRPTPVGNSCYCIANGGRTYGRAR